MRFCSLAEKADGVPHLIMSHELSGASAMSINPFWALSVSAEHCMTEGTPDAARLERKIEMSKKPKLPPRHKARPSIWEHFDIAFASG